MSTCSVVIGICGASNGGKTTLAQKLLENHPLATLIQQDNFYKESNKIPLSKDEKIKLWDVVEAIDVQKLVDAVQLAIVKTESSFSNEATVLPGGPKHLIIVEGTMLLCMRDLIPLLHAVYFITLDHDTMKERRNKRKYPGLPDPPHYFDDHVWPSYIRNMKLACGAHRDGSVRMLDGTNEISDNHQELEIKINELSLLASHGDLCNNR